MADAEALKTQLISLWGIDTNAINVKLSELRIFLTNNVPDITLLNLLLKSDLDIERAINLHFTSDNNRTPTPNPPIGSIINDNNHNINNNHNNNDDEYVFNDDSDNSNSNNNNENEFNFLFPDSDDNKQNENENKNEIDLDLALDLELSPDTSPNENNLRRGVESDNDTESDDLQILNPNINIRNANINSNSNHNNNNNNRKRGYQQMMDHMDIDDFPRNKRRKLSVSNHISYESDNENENNNNSNNTNNNNDNSNNNNSNNSNNNNLNNNDSINKDMEMDEKPEAKYNDNWERKIFGSLIFECTPIDSSGMYNMGNCSEFCRKASLGQIDIHKINDLNEEQVQSMRRNIILELRNIAVEKSENGINVRFVKKKTISEPKSDIEKEQREFNLNYKREFDHICNNSFGFRKGDLNDSIRAVIDEIVREKIRIKKPPGKYRIEFEISVNRRKSQFSAYLRHLRKPITTFDINSPYLMCALYSNNNKLITYIENVENITKEYADKGHTYSMGSLLDFACQYNYNINDKDENYKHLLNIKLHQYQLQSLHWMLDEEQDDIGFMRNFFCNIRFTDNTKYYYSPLFNKLIVNKKYLPKTNGGFLCEEMGLGKTIISLALININKPNFNNNNNNNNGLVVAHRKMVEKTRRDMSVISEDYPFGLVVKYQEEYVWYKSSATLIIAPTSLVGQWEKECDDKSGGKLRYKRYYGQRKRAVELYINMDIIFTTYGILASERGEDRKMHVLHQIEWHRIILDESHSIKNGGTVSAKSIAKLRSKNKWCLTGTPFGRQPSDIENQLKFIGMDTSYVSKLHLKDISKHQLFNGRSSVGSYWEKQSKPLLNVIKSVIMRHTKSQKFNGKAIVNMPDKEEDIIYIQFTEKQREYYNKLYNTAKQRYEYYKSIGNIPRGSISILSSLHPARQACSGHIYNIEEIELSLSTAQARTFKIQQMVKNTNNLNLSSAELFGMALEEAYDDTEGECPICMECPYEEPLQTPCRHIFCKECIMDILRNNQPCPLCRTKFNAKQLKRPYSKEEKEEMDKKEEEKGNDKEEMDDDNDEKKHNDGKIRFDSKLKVLMTELNKIRNQGKNEKALVFTSFSKSLNWICSELKTNGFEYRTLTGSMSMNKRKKQLQEFSDNNNVSVFVLTVRSGAVGITLTAANHVFMLEPPFNAALHRQAINRVYRLGQKKKVYIKTLIMKDSIEERIWNINKNKNDINSEHDNNDNNDNNNNNNNNKKNKNNNLAGNIHSDKSANLAKNEISQLFEDNNNENE